MFFWHPRFRIIGRERLDPDGCYIYCANHSSASDPVWLLLAIHPKKRKKCPRVIAKDILMKIPLLRLLFQWVGVFGIRRGEADLTAVRTALGTLKSGRSLIVFPQGTRCKNREHLPGKNGAAMFATRTGTKVLPIYLSDQRKLFGPITCVVGEPYWMEFEGKKADNETLDRLTEELMHRIYALEP